jgi:hypothetical protein
MQDLPEIAPSPQAKPGDKGNAAARIAALPAGRERFIPVSR